MNDKPSPALRRPLAHWRVSTDLMRAIVNILEQIPGSASRDVMNRIENITGSHECKPRYRDELEAEDRRIEALKQEIADVSALKDAEIDRLYELNERKAAKPGEKVPDDAQDLKAAAPRRRD